MDRRVANRKTTGSYPLNRVLMAITAVFILLSGGVVHADGGELDSRLAIAEAKYAEARAEGFSWRANRIVLDRAKAAIAANQPDEALELLAEAIALSEASLAQARDEAKNWSTRFPFQKN